MKFLRQNLITILIVGLLIRLLLAFSYDTGDSGAFCSASDLFLKRQEVYANPNVYFSGPPFALHLTAVSHLIAKKIELPCSGMWKLPTIITDIGIGYLIYLISRRHLKFDIPKSLHLTSWYIYNPISIIIAGFHGQQDPFWLFFVLLSWYLIVTHHTIFAAISAGIGFAYKIPTAILLPALVLTIKKTPNQIFFTLMVGIIFIGSLFPEIITSRSALIRQSFLYSSLPGVWGFSGLVPKELLPSTVNLLKIALGVSLGINYLFSIRNQQFDFFQTAIRTITLFYIFTPGFGSQYLLWILPFLVITNHSLLKHYTILVSFAYLHTYGFGIPAVNLIMQIINDNLIYKLKVLYPYDLYYPIWILSFFILFQKEELVIRFTNRLTKLIYSLLIYHPINKLYSDINRRIQL